LVGGKGWRFIPGTDKATSALTVVSLPQNERINREINSQTNQDNEMAGELTRTDGRRELESKALTLPIPEPESLHIPVSIDPVLAIKTHKPPDLMILHDGSSIINQSCMRREGLDGLVVRVRVLPPVPCMTGNMKGLRWACMQAPPGPLSYCQCEHPILGRFYRIVISIILIFLLISF
jgi:hypothetical protein